MKIRVFGKDTDDKGTQLEILTKRLLESRGYRQVGLNSIGSGGTRRSISSPSCHFQGFTGLTALK